MAKINFPDGSNRVVPLVTTSAAVGYIATSIEIGGADVKHMRMLFERNPDQFRAFIFQLEMRFPENRGVLKPETAINARQTKVLMALNQDDQAERYSSLHNMAIDLQMTKNHVRLAVRALARKGLAQRVSWHDDDGYIRGSGYGITETGKKLATEIGSMP